MLLVEGPENPTADRIRNTLNDNLRKLYIVSIEDLQSHFTFVTDAAAVMAKMAGSSVSNRIVSQMRNGCVAMCIL